METQVLILGAGPAGLMAGIYAARAGLKTIILTGANQGGQLLLTHKIENFPGFMEITGVELVEKLTQQALNAGVQLISQSAKSVSVKKNPFVIKTETDEYQCDALIIATGASPKWLNLKGEAEFKGHGLSVCAVCDGFFYKNKSVMVIGGGNTAAYEALYLSKIAKKVYLLHRRDTLRAEYHLAEQVLNNPKIEILWNAQAVQFKGDKKLSSAVIRFNEGTEKEIAVEGVFEAIGQTPNAGIFHGQVERDESGFIITDKRTMETSVPGVFACGDVQEKGHRQAIIAAASGALAALSAEKYLLG